MSSKQGVSSLGFVDEAFVFSRRLGQVLDELAKRQRSSNLYAKDSLVRYIVLIDESSEKSNVETAAEDLLDSAGISAEIKEVFSSINGFVVDLSAEQADRLGADSRVVNIEQDGITPELPSPTEPQLESLERTKTKIFFSKDVDVKDLLSRAESTLKKLNIDAGVAKLLKRKNGFVAKLTKEEVEEL